MQRALSGGSARGEPPRMQRALSGGSARGEPPRRKRALGGDLQHAAADLAEHVRFDVPSAGHRFRSCQPVRADDARVVAPKPAQRVREDGTAVEEVVAAGSQLEPMVVAGEHQRGGHGEVGQCPVAFRQVDVVLAILEVRPDGPGAAAGFANEGRILAAARKPREAADVAQDLAEGVRTFPGGRERGKAAVAPTADRAAGGVVRQAMLPADLRQDLFEQETRVGVRSGRVLAFPLVAFLGLRAGVHEHADGRGHGTLVDEVVEHRGRPHGAFRAQVAEAILEHHHASRLSRFPR